MLIYIRQLVSSFARSRTVASSAAFLGGLLVSAQAFAQADAGAAAQQPNQLLSFVPILVVFAVIYFFVMRPQMKRQKEQQVYLSNLQRGDEVVTTAGILGRIEGLTDSHVTLEIAPNVRIRVVRSFIAGSAKVQGAGAEVKV